MIAGKDARRAYAASAVRQLAKFASCGGVSAATDIGTYSLIVHVIGMHPLVANPISRSLGGLVSFLLNRHWTFKETRAGRFHMHFAKFWIVWLGAMGLSETLIWILHSLSGVGPVWAKLIAEGITGIIVFFVHRHWTYR